ncbi:hypothetical protein HPP92_001805 [Vanilla planifolia]|uniref:Uncharacterized protein n=1 Tax=Vanilla planifolia TaxID=51239 RepID=A0A835RWX2_VANPL|nr:hypothetical protein HPP92_001805 [Vanilla planifolia]
MGYMSRLWVAASVAVVGGAHADNGAKWNAGIATMRLGRERLADAGVLPASVFCAFVRSRSGGVLHEEDSVRRAMYLSCWGPS